MPGTDCAIDTATEIDTTTATEIGITIAIESATDWVVTTDVAQERERGPPRERVTCRTARSSA